jgi:hypothetical protein
MLITSISFITNYNQMKNKNTILFYSSKINYLKRTWWRLFQTRAVRTKFDIYEFINTMHVFC